MSKAPRVVAELGRPETPAETAARKAESSKIYRSSQTMRGLIAALIVTVAVVAVIVFAVPRGEPVARPAIDLDNVAANVADTMSAPVLVPKIPDDWQVNAAKLKSTSAIPVWDIVAAPSGENARGFLHIAQAFGADVTWAPQVMNGMAPTDTRTIDGQNWDVFSVKNPSENGNVATGLGTQAGDDYVIVYGSLSVGDTAEFIQKNLTPQIRELTEDQ